MPAVQNGHVPVLEGREECELLEVVRVHLSQRLSMHVSLA